MVNTMTSYIYPSGQVLPVQTTGGPQWPIYNIGITQSFPSINTPGSFDPANFLQSVGTSCAQWSMLSPAWKTATMRGYATQKVYYQYPSQLFQGGWFWASARDAQGSILPETPLSWTGSGSPVDSQVFINSLVTGVDRYCAFQNQRAQISPSALQSATAVSQKGVYPSGQASVCPAGTIAVQDAGRSYCMPLQSSPACPDGSAATIDQASGQYWCSIAQGAAPAPMAAPPPPPPPPPPVTAPAPSSVGASIQISSPALELVAQAIGATALGVSQALASSDTNQLNQLAQQSQSAIQTLQTQSMSTGLDPMAQQQLAALQQVQAALVQKGVASPMICDPNPWTDAQVAVMMLVAGALAAAVTWVATTAPRR
jgi:hypothetical protein